MTTTPESWEQQLHDAANTIPDTETTPGSLREQIVAALMRVESWYQPTEMHHRQADAVLRAVDPLLRERDEALSELTRWQSMFGSVDTAQARLDGQEAVRQALADHITSLYQALGWPADLDPDDALARAGGLHDAYDTLVELCDDATKVAEAAGITIDTAAIPADAIRTLHRERDEARAENERLRQLREIASEDSDRIARAGMQITANLRAERAALWGLLKRQTRQMRTWRRRANTALAEAVEQTARDMQRAGQLRRERDEARAEVERLREPAPATDKDVLTPVGGDKTGSMSPCDSCPWPDAPCPCHGPAREDTPAPACTDMGCTRIGGRCVGYHCPHCEQPTGMAGHRCRPADTGKEADK